MLYTASAQSCEMLPGNPRQTARPRWLAATATSSQAPNRQALAAMLPPNCLPMIPNFSAPESPSEDGSPIVTSPRMRSVPSLE